MRRESTIPVVILCGGKGTRLGNVTRIKPKPLVTVGGMPILWHIMKMYAAAGHRRFVLCLGYKGDLIEEFFTQGTITGKPVGTGRSREPDWEIIFARTGEETGTSGRVFRIEPHIKEHERFFLTYGDGVASVPIQSLLEYHLEKEKLATVTAVRPSTTFGILKEKDGLVTGFEEKPRLDVLINGGFFVMERGVFEYLDEDGALERAPLSRLTTKRELAVFRHEGFWQCMDDQKQVDMLNGMWDRGERPWAFWESGGASNDTR
jgi:glucose-1-phosphate cytidylyltransferase